MGIFIFNSDYNDRKILARIYLKNSMGSNA